MSNTLPVLCRPAAVPQVRRAQTSSRPWRRSRCGLCQSDPVAPVVNKGRPEKPLVNGHASQDEDSPKSGFRRIESWRRHTGACSAWPATPGSPRISRCLPQVMRRRCRRFVVRSCGTVPRPDGHDGGSPMACGWTRGHVARR
jgi:hypothetical protein